MLQIVDFVIVDIGKRASCGLKLTGEYLIVFSIVPHMQEQFEALPICLYLCFLLFLDQLFPSSKSLWVYTTPQHPMCYQLHHHLNDGCYASQSLCMWTEHQRVFLFFISIFPL